MNRREFFKRAALIAAGVVAADQLELLERLAHKKVWAGHSFIDPPKLLSIDYECGFLISEEMLEDDFMYIQSDMVNAWSKHFLANAFRS